MKKAIRQPVRVGVCWYTEEEWNKVKAEAVDPELFKETYAEWERMAEKALRDLHESGIDPDKVLVFAGELRQWCETHNAPNNSAFRSALIAQLLGEKRAVIV